MASIRHRPKKLLAFILIFTLISLPGNIFANSSDLGEIYVYFNGQRMEFDQPPVIVNDRTMVPFRAIFEAFGAEVEWNQELQQVLATGQNPARIVLNIGSERAFIDGQPHYLDAPAFVAPETSRTLVPIRFVSEAFGADVKWDGDARNVIISAELDMPETPLWEDYIDETIGGGTAIDPEEYAATGEWHPTHRNQIVGGYYYNVRGWRMSLASYHEMIAERDRIVAQIINPEMSEFEIVRAAHNWLVYNVSYNTDAWNRQRLQQTGSGWNPAWQPVRYAREHQMAWSAFMLRTAVCAGYTDALIYLLEPFGIEALYVSGPLFNQGFSEGTHAWNLVNVGGQWYHIDATWNRFYSGGYHMVAYTWFLLSDHDIRNTGQTTRSWSMSLFPSAPDTFTLSRPGLIWDHGLDRWRSRTPRDDVSFSISASMNIHNAGRVTSNPASSRQGQWVTLNAQANPGFEFQRWEVVSGGFSFHSQSGSSATFMMPANNVSVRAVFSQIQQGYPVFLSISNFQAGMASVSPHTNVRQGDWVSLQAYANPGFEFDRWEIVFGAANIQDPHSPSTGFSMPEGEVSVRAMFKQAQGQTVSVIVDDTQRGTFSANPSSNVAPGAWVSLQANAGPGFEFYRWEIISGTVQIQNLYSAATGFPMPDGEVAVRAVFRPIAAQAHSVTVSVSDAAAGTAGASPNLGVTQGSLVNLQADANPGFEFDRWEVVYGGAAIQNLTSAATSFVMTASDVSVRAVFEPVLPQQQFSVSVSANNHSAGNAQASPTAAVTGDVVSISAQAQPGFTFSHWEVLTNNAVIPLPNSASASFIMPGANVTVMAYFIDD